jgi:hypothetical protein
MKELAVSESLDVVVKVDTPMTENFLLLPVREAAAAASA